MPLSFRTVLIIDIVVSIQNLVEYLPIFQVVLMILTMLLTIAKIFEIVKNNFRDKNK